MKRSLLVLAICLSAVSPLDAAETEPLTTRVSVATGGSESRGTPLFNGNGPVDISGEGRYVAFGSSAFGLVPDDTNRGVDVFVHDRLSATTERVSLRADGGQADRGVGDYYAAWPSISADGRFVVFGSLHDDLTAGDANGKTDLFVRDRLERTTQIVSVSTDGVSADGDSWGASISADGSTVAFASSASNLTPGDDNGHVDVFIRDIAGETTTMVSADTTGTPGNSDSRHPSISADGRRVAFVSDASNFVPGDDRWSVDLFVSDAETGIVRRVNEDREGRQYCWEAALPALSGNGEWVAAWCAGRGDVYVFEVATGDFELVSENWRGGSADDSSWGPTISHDGRFVAFSSRASNLVPDDVNQMRDHFVRDRLTGTTALVSVSWTGEQQLTYDGVALTASDVAAISDDGSAVAFESFAPNLVEDDRNGIGDVFVFERPACSPGPLSRRVAYLGQDEIACTFGGVGL